MVLLALVLLFASNTPVDSFRPYVTCVGCETFLQCFLTCPVADYPGVNQWVRRSMLSKIFDLVFTDLASISQNSCERLSKTRQGGQLDLRGNLPTILTSEENIFRDDFSLMNVITFKQWLRTFLFDGLAGLHFACTCKQGKPKQKIQWCSWLKPRCDHFRNWRPFYPRRYRGYHRLNPALPWVMGGGNNYRPLSLIIWHSAVQQLIWKSAV